MVRLVLRRSLSLACRAPVANLCAGRMAPCLLFEQSFGESTQSMVPNVVLVFAVSSSRSLSLAANFFF